MRLRLILEGLEKAFDSKQVLRGASFAFEQGKIYGLLGRNGAGKTTLFNCLSRELSMDAGEVWLEDESESGRAALKDTDVGYVFSLPILPEFLTGYEFVQFFLEANPGKAQAGVEIDGWFDRMRISAEDRHRLIKGYSHGMKNKLQMLLYLIAKPPVILLDEPLTSFDVIVALEMKQLLREMKKDHILIFSTHILQLATDLCDELVILNQGQLSAVSSDLLGSPDFEQSVISLLKDEPAHG